MTEPKRLKSKFYRECLNKIIANIELSAVAGCDVGPDLRALDSYIETYVKWKQLEVLGMGDLLDE